MTKDSEFLKRYKLLFARYVDLESGEIVDLEFKKQIEVIRQERDSTHRRVLANSLILKCKFPYAMESFLKEFIVDNRMDFQLLSANLFLVSPSYNEVVTGADEPLEHGILKYVRYSARQGKVRGFPEYTKGDNSKLHMSNELKLVIGKNATIEQIIDFIRTNKKHIKDFQAQLRDDGNLPTRVRPLVNLKRDMRILELKEKGMKHKEIAATITRDFPNAVIAYGDIPTILRNLKNK